MRVYWLILTLLFLVGCNTEANTKWEYCQGRVINLTKHRVGESIISTPIADCSFQLVLPDGGKRSFFIRGHEKCLALFEDDNITVYRYKLYNNRDWHDWQIK